MAEKIKTHILCSVTFFLNHAIYEIKWKNIVKLDRAQIRIWCMCIARWIPKVTNTQLEIYNTYCFPTATTVT